MANQKVTDFGQGPTSGLNVYGARSGKDTGAVLGSMAGKDTGAFPTTFDTGGLIADTGNRSFFTDTGTWFQALDTGKFVADTGDALLDNLENQTISGGAEITIKDLGVEDTGTLTINVGARPFQKVTNNGAFILAPGSVKGSTILEVVNDTGSPGIITITGFTNSSGSFDTGDGNTFHCPITVGDSGSLIVIQAVQTGGT